MIGRYFKLATEKVASETDGDKNISNAVIDYSTLHHPFIYLSW